MTAMHGDGGPAATGGNVATGVGAFPRYRLGMAVSIAPSRFQAIAQPPDLPALFSHLAALGFSGVELGVRNPADADAGRLSHQLRQAGLQPVAIATGQMFVDDGLNLSSPDEAVRKVTVERLYRQVELAAALGCPWVIIGLVRGRTHPGLPERDALQRVRDGLEALAAYAAPRQVSLLVEPINRYETDLASTLDAAWELCRGVLATSLLADTFHMNIEEPVIEASLIRHARHIGHVHLADSNRFAPGQGHLDFRSILAVLAATGYRGWLSAEILPLPDVPTAAARTVEFLRAVVATLPATAGAADEGGAP